VINNIVVECVLTFMGKIIINVNNRAGGGDGLIMMKDVNFPCFKHKDEKFAIKRIVA
jgi:hypothetical protein